MHRLGFGTMQLIGPGVWGPPADPDDAVRCCGAAVGLGVDLIDTADSYGPDVAEELVRQALHPYPAGLTIATKAGSPAPGPDEWQACGRPDYLKRQCEGSLGASASTTSTCSSCTGSTPRSRSTSSSVR